MPRNPGGWGQVAPAVSEASLLSWLGRGACAPALVPGVRWLTQPLLPHLLLGPIRGRQHMCCESVLLAVD